MNYKWQHVDCKGTKPLARSSHALNVVGTTAYIMGGEHEPRVPIGSAVWCLDVPSATWRQLQTTGVEVPPRNAHAAAVVGTSIYIFGGRHGIAMGEGSVGDMYRLDTTTSFWSPVSMSGDVPEARSYHQMTSIGSKLYVFGGCVPSGRLNDLHSFDTDTGIWRKLPSSDVILGRGGAGFTAVGNKLYVIGGFTGKEMGDMHVFDTETFQWREMQVAPALLPRSVFGVASLGSRIFVIGGEVDPSSLGHAGAGQFGDEVYVLDTKEQTAGWQKVEVSGDKLSHRGWFSAAEYGPDGVLVFGGCALDNSRLDDAFLLKVL